MDGNGSILNTNITIGADIEAAKSGIQSVKADIESVGPTADGASEQTQEAIGRVVSRLDDIIAILDGVEKKTKDVTEFSKRAWGSAADAMNPYIASFGKVEKLTDSAASSTEEAGGKINSALGSVGDTLEKSTSGVRKFVGALSSVAGVATGLLGVIGLVTGAFVALLEVFKRLNAEGSDEGIGKTKENLRSLFDEISGAGEVKAPVFIALQEEIEELTGRLHLLKNVAEDYKQGDTPIQDFFKVKDSIKDIDDLQKRLDSLLEQREALLRNARDLRDTEISREMDDAVEAFERLDEARSKYFDALRDQNNVGEIDFLPEDSQIDARFDYLRKKIEDSAADLHLGIDDEEVRRALNLIELQRTAALERERIADEAEAKRQDEKDRREAERTAKQIEQLREGMNGIFGTDFTTRIDSLVQVLREGNNSIGRLK